MPVVMHVYEMARIPNSRQVAAADCEGLLTAVHDCSAQVMLWQLLLARTNDTSDDCNQAAYTCLANAHGLQMIITID